LRPQESCHKFRAMWGRASSVPVAPVASLSTSADGDVVRALAHRLDGVEDDVAHLAARFGRLNARITAALRYVPEEYEDEREEE